MIIKLMNKQMKKKMMKKIMKAKAIKLKKRILIIIMRQKKKNKLTKKFYIYPAQNLLVKCQKIIAKKL